MRLVTFTHGGRTRIGRVTGDGDDLAVVDVTATTDVPADMVSLLEAGPEALAVVRDTHGPTLGLEEVRLEAPVQPRVFWAVGLNYADHAAETGREPPGFPVVFNKQVTCVQRPGGPVVIPRESSEVDYEGELAFVIGRRCRRVPAAEAASVIAGWTIVNDVSVRDWQRRSPTMTLGKSWDTHGPLGPWIVTADELGDPHGLGLRTWVDDELRQSSDTGKLIFDCWRLVETLSTVCTLRPGDVVSTGTPDGVGMAHDPPRYLRPGQVVRITIEGIGTLENPVVAEDPA